MAGLRYGPHGQTLEGATQAKACRYESFLLPTSTSTIAHRVLAQIDVARPPLAVSNVTLRIYVMGQSWSTHAFTQEP